MYPRRTVRPTYSKSRHRVLGLVAELGTLRAGNVTHFNLRRLGWLEWVRDADGHYTEVERLTAEGREMLAHWDYEYGTDARR